MLYIGSLHPIQIIFLLPGNQSKNEEYEEYEEYIFTWSPTQLTYAIK